MLNFENSGLQDFQNVKEEEKEEKKRGTTEYGKIGQFRDLPKVKPACVAAAG